ncbi:MAG: type II toxin-antitoxin system RelE/ParE family toxin [Desulfobacterales bacterium]|jgi:mRNA interferase RelE/StbE|nr:type II toxin-antitoxin system RelE/ParE family toxin [Desulfobacterales bacterium]
MALYKIEWKRSATKELRSLPSKAIKKILATVEELTTNPHPIASIKLSGTEHTYRIRTGEYRIVYNMLDQVLVIAVIRVGHRKDVYRHLS